jgi:hypothetical protein
VRLGSLVQAKAALARSGQRTTEMLDGLDVAFVRNAKAALQWVPADGGATPLAELVREYFRYESTHYCTDCVTAESLAWHL